jgi:hypothetical protein
MVLAGAFVFLVFIAVVRSNATPIEPDLKKLLEQQRHQDEFPLARAGWNGSEMKDSAPATNATLEELGPASTARQVREALRSVAIPDYRAVAGILLVILLLRRIRQARKLAPAEPSSGRVAAIGMADSPQEDRAERERAA